MMVGEGHIQSIAWARFRLATGPATQFGDVLIAMLRSRDDVEIRAVWRHVENAVFAQNDIFSAAEPTVDSMMAALVDERPAHVRDQVVELLYFLLTGGSAEDPDLARRCHAMAARGLWLMVGEAATREGRAREAALEVVELIDPHVAAIVRPVLGDATFGF